MSKVQDFTQLQRGQVVKPTAEAARVSNFREESRLVMRQSRSRRTRHCSACYAAALEREGYSSERLPTRPTQQRLSREAFFVIEAGELYPAATEISSHLCLEHVEAADQTKTCEHKRTGTLHPCPYEEDIHDNPKPHCMCCKACQRECARDI